MSQSFDMDPWEFKRHIRAVESRSTNAELRKKETSQSDPQVGSITTDFAHCTDSTSFLLGLWGCPPEFRGFIDALIGVAGYRAGHCKWFSASDNEVASRANRSTKWVQNMRRGFLEWQKRQNVAMVDIEDNDYNDGHPIPHKYRVNVARAAAESTLNARQSRQWGVNPGIALEEAARTMRDSLPEVPVHRRHKKSSRPDAATKMSQDLSFALTKVRKAKQTHKLTLNHVELDAKTLETIANIRIELDAF